MEEEKRKFDKEVDEIERKMSDRNTSVGANDKNDDEKTEYELLE